MKNEQAENEQLQADAWELTPEGSDILDAMVYSLTLADLTDTTDKLDGKTAASFSGLIREYLSGRQRNDEAATLIMSIVYEMLPERRTEAIQERAKDYAEERATAIYDREMNGMN